MTDQVCCSLGFVYIPTSDTPTTDYSSLLSDPVPSWCRCCIPRPNQFTQIPLYRRHLKAQFREADLVVTERQDYLHRLKEEVEAEFRFPAKTVSLFKFQYQIDDEDWVDMKVEEKRKAEREYQQAINQGHQAVLAKQDNSKIYTVKVGRLKPNQKISLRFSYYSTYEITSESLSYTVPLTSMPPYVRPGDSSDGLPTWHTPSWSNSFDKDLPYGITLDATFDRSSPFSVNFIGEKVTEFQSDENSLTIPRQTLDGRTNVTFQLKPTDGFTSRAFQWTNPEGQQYLQVCLANYFKSDEPVPEPTSDHFNPDHDGDWEVVDSEVTPVQRRVILIGDGSGSMGGQPIKDLKNAMELALKDQPRSAKFSLAMFGSDFKFFPEGQRLTSTGTNGSYYQPPAATIVNGQTVHNGYACDGCQALPIIGTRYRCQDCPDYDLCDKCHQQNQTSSFHFAGHTFKAIDGQKEDPLESMPRVEEKTYWLEQTDETMAAAQKWMDLNVNSNHGGTEMFKVINEAYHRLLTTRSPSQKYHDMILFMTDGDVWGQQPTQMTSLIQKHADSITLFSMGIGHSHSADLVEKLAKAGNGFCSHVYFSEDVPEQVQMTMRCLTSAHLRNAQLVWDDCEVVSTSTKPTTLLFENEPHYVLAKVTSMGENPTLTLKTNWRGQDKVVTTLSLKDLPQSGFPLDQSFAMTQLKEWLNTPAAQMSKKEKSEKITPLAIEYNVITPYTAAVGIIKSSTASSSAGELKKIDIPIATPQRGRSTNEGVYATAAACAMMYDCDDGLESDDCEDLGLFSNSFFSASNTQARFSALSVKKGSALHSISKGINTVGSTLRNANVELKSEVSTAQTTVSPWTSKSDQTIMEDLIKLQSFDGSWTSNAVRSAALSWTFTRSSWMTDNDFPTYQVLAFFHRLMAMNARWNRAYNKALSWLSGNVHPADVTLDQTFFLQLAGTMTQVVPTTTGTSSVSTSETQ